MTDHVPVHRLFETHLTMSDLQRSIVFYRDVVAALGSRFRHPLLVD